MTFTTDEQATTDHTNICTDASINPTEDGELIPSASIDRIIAFRKQGLETYAQAIALFNESKKNLKVQREEVFMGYHIV